MPAVKGHTWGGLASILTFKEAISCLFLEGRGADRPLSVCGHLAGTFIRVAAFLVRDHFTQTPSPAARVWDVSREDKRQRADGESSLALYFFFLNFKMVVDLREVAKI